MLRNPTKVKIGDTLYPINTDFRIAIECNEIAQDDTIGEYERALAIIYKLFGDKGLDNPEHYNKLLELGQKYLLCGKELDKHSVEDADMDFIQDMNYIETSFQSDYNMDLSTVDMHWWKFCDLLNGLSNSELGNCCILNRVRNLRNMDASKIQDSREREKVVKAQKEVALHKKEKPLTKEQIESIKLFNKLAGIKD